MAKIEWIEQRLQNWARWRLRAGGEGPLGYASVELGGGANMGRSGYVEAAIPIGDVEAAETDSAIARLYPGGLRLTVIEVYTGRGGMKDKAKRLACGESTIHARIDQAHKQLAEHFMAQNDRFRNERYRLEALLVKGDTGTLSEF